MGVGTAAGPVVAPAAVVSSLRVVVVIFHLAVSTTVIIVAVTPQSGTPGKVDSYVVRARETLPNTARKEGSRAQSA